jgi:hypothetical protein
MFFNIGALPNHGTGHVKDHTKKPNSKAVNGGIYRLALGSS